jgi:opacity protein-like surface antigen
MHSVNRHSVLRILAAATLAAAIGSSAASAQETNGLYIRVGAGWDDSHTTVLHDRACDVTPLLNLFGCGAGEDGRRLGARGSFGSAFSGALAAGVRVRPGVRFEAEASHRSGFALDAQANFLRAGAVQPVGADVSQTALIGRIVLDVVVDPIGPFVPYLAAGAGASRNDIGPVLFEFPALATQPATTAVGGGVRWQAAWDLGAGASLKLGGRTSLEVGYRYSDFGHVMTDDGRITVIRGTRETPVDNVAGLSSRLRSQGVLVGLRQAL